MAAICYYGNVMATTRWRLCGKRYPNIQITQAPSRMLVAYTQIEPYEYISILHLQQYSRRLNLFVYIFLLCSSITEPPSHNTHYLLTDVFVWSDLRVGNQHA